MTAAYVDGVPVVACEAAVSGLKDPAGKSVPFKQTLRLLLEDGREVYGCIHCDYTSPNINSIRPHLNRHRDTKRAAESPAEHPIDVRDVVARLNAVDRIVRERDEWKARAIRAEGDLAALRRAFGRAGVR